MQRQHVASGNVCEQLMRFKESASYNTDGVGQEAVLGSSDEVTEKGYGGNTRQY